MCLDDFLAPPVRDPHIWGSKGRVAPGRGSAASKQRQFSLVLSFAAKRENILPGRCPLSILQFPLQEGIVFFAKESPMITEHETVFFINPNQILNEK